MAIPIALALVVVGCADGGSGASVEPQVAVVEGVRDVTNPAPQWGPENVWRVAQEPRLTLGVEAGEPYEMFTNPSAVRLPDGRIVVADRGANELRYFDGQGTYLYTRGRSGEGPGEYGGIGPVWARADGGLIIDDFRLQRTTALDPQGELESTFTLQPHEMEYTPARAIALLADGSLLAQATKRPFVRVPAGQVEWQMMGLFHYAPDGTNPRHVIDVPYMERSGGEMGMVFYSQGHLSIDPEGRVFFSDGRSFDVTTYGLDGVVQQRFRRAGEPVAVTEADKQAWIDKSRANIAEHGGDPNAEARVANMHYPELMPTVAGMTRDALGDVWVRRYLGVKYSWAIFYESHQAFRPEESVWDVFTPDGLWLGTVDLPVDRYPMQIGDNWVLMGGESDNGVQQVFLYDLIKP